MFLGTDTSLEIQGNECLRPQLPEGQEWRPKKKTQTLCCRITAVHWALILSGFLPLQPPLGIPNPEQTCLHGWGRRLSVTGSRGQRSKAESLCSLSGWKLWASYKNVYWSPHVGFEVIMMIAIILECPPYVRLRLRYFTYSKSFNQCNNPLRGWFHYYPHFTVEETKTQKGEAIHAGLHIQWVAQRLFKFGPSAPVAASNYHTRVPSPDVAGWGIPEDPNLCFKG